MVVPTMSLIHPKWKEGSASLYGVWVYTRFSKRDNYCDFLLFTWRTKSSQNGVKLVPLLSTPYLYAVAIRGENQSKMGSTLKGKNLL